MKKTLITTLALALVCSGALLSLGLWPHAEAATISKTLQRPSNNLGLVGWWTMDGKDMIPNVRDMSGQGNHGNLVGFTSTTTVPGKLGQALKFDSASSQYVSVGSNLGFTGNTNMSVVGWAYRASLGDHGAFFKLGCAVYPGGANDGFAIGIGSTGSGNGFEDSGDNLIALYENARWIDTGLSVGIGWHHFALVINGSGYPAVYWDGSSVYSDTTGAPIAVGSTGTSIANIAGYIATNGNNRYFKGSLDDVRIYNRALSASDVSDIYRMGVNTHTSTSMSGSGSLSSGLIGWWTFDGKDMIPNARDRSGQGNHGNLGGFTSTTTVPGKLGQALTFDGAANYVDVGTVFAGQTYPLTFSAWVKPATLAQNCIILNFDVTGTNSDYAFGIYNAANQILVGVPGYQYGLSGVSTYLTAGQWSHWVAVFTDTTHVTFYLNGVQKTLSNLSQYYSVDGSRTTIGDRQGSPADKFFNGSLDDVRIYNRALSASDVLELYNMGQPAQISASLPGNDSTAGSGLANGLVGWWTFDGKNMTSNVADSSGQGNNGNLVGFTSTTTVPGKLGQALSFSDTNTYVDLGITSSAFNFAADVSGVAWIKTAVDGRIILDYQLSNPLFYMQVGATTAGGTANKFVAYLRTDSGSVLVASGLVTVTDNKWHQVAFTRSVSAQEVRLYVDGVLDNTYNYSDAGPINTSGVSSAHQISNVGSYVFNGSIDDVRIYNRALSAAEVTRLYQMGR